MEKRDCNEASHSDQLQNPAGTRSGRFQIRCNCRNTIQRPGKDGGNFIEYSGSCHMEL
jgi:hypothetical protein